jgi:hypothetical protein
MGLVSGDGRTSNALRSEFYQGTGVHNIALESPMSAAVGGSAERSGATPVETKF